MCNYLTNIHNSSSIFIISTSDLSHEGLLFLIGDSENLSRFLDLILMEGSGSRRVKCRLIALLMHNPRGELGKLRRFVIILGRVGESDNLGSINLVLV